MKKQHLALISLFLAMIMLAGAFASCAKNEVSDPTSSTTPPTNQESESESQGTFETSQSTESSPAETESTGNETDSEGIVESEKNETAEPEDPSLEGEHADIIGLSSQLKNGVSSFYTDSTKTSVTIKNLNMLLGYNIKSSSNNMQISHLSTPDGNPYITNTMDVVLNMEDGRQFVASKSQDNATLNIYRYGYYYFENRIEGQSFKNNITADNEYVIDHSALKSKNNIKITEKKSDGTVVYQRIGGDPWMSFKMDTVNTADYDFIELTMRANQSASASELFIVAGDETTFTSANVHTFTPTAGEEFVTYRIPLSSFDCYKGELKAVRLDINVNLKDTFEISKLRLIKANYNGAPQELKIQRTFATYSDKLHHIVQFSTPEIVEGVKNVQIVTRIAASTVEKFVVKDRKAARDNLDDVLWQAVEYVGFDIKNAGVFGYILPAGEMGTLAVTLEDGYYVITQTKEIANGQFIPSSDGSRNANDVFMGHRIYTDQTHDFAALALAAECERNPLEAENNIVADSAYDSAKFAGYDPLYGFYKFTVKGTSFNKAYYEFPNKQYRVKFSVKGDKYERNAYFMTYTTSGGLECAALLDSKDMLLPVDLEVCKNFAGDGENTIFNLDDAAYGEVFFPLPISAFEEKQYTVLNLYQNWGKFPLKQISSIQYFTPYYHLSTGVTETNCIVQLATTGPGLPDHRAMSAPFWPTQPQHNSGGGHAFLFYTDANGIYSPSDNTSAVIDSYGPTYCDITLGYQSADGKVVAQYTHTEMPQTDENRAYYEMKYTFKEDVSFKDFSNDFRFYRVTDNNPTGTYKKVGYLDENNVSQVVDSIQTSGDKQSFVLGDNAPYFSFFDMPDYDPEYKHAFGYTNLSFLVYNYEVVLNGEKIDTNFVLTNTKDFLALSLNLGKVTFKAGDTITINAILMPWGSQESDYSGEEPDFNVREVRRNTILNPHKASADKDCEIIESVFLPKIRTTNGKSAEFTLSGGHNNVSVRVYGFNKLTAPVIEEYVDGKWVPYVVNSIATPDAYDNGYYYDGYMVHYDSDGTYSYSFVAEMNNGAERKFRLSATNDFEGWAGEVPPDPVEEERNDPINIYVDAEELYKMTLSQGSFSSVALADDGSYVRFAPNSAAGEAYINVYSINNAYYSNLTTTGQYVIVKYRASATTSARLESFEIFTNTESATALGADHCYYKAIDHDGDWHVLIFDVSALISKHIIPEENGTYIAQYLRFDVFNKKNLPADAYVDVAYIGMCDSLETLYSMNTDMDEVLMVTGETKQTAIDPKTGEAVVEVIPPPSSYVDPSSGYTVSSVPNASWIDFVNGVKASKGSAYDKDVTRFNFNSTTIQNSILSMAGWTCAEGGIEKYVWSADGGKTWNDIIFSNGRTSLNDAYQGHFDAVTDITAGKYVIQDKENSKINVGYQGTASLGAKIPGIAADLTPYIGQTVNVTFAAVPKTAPDTLCIIIHITDVRVLPHEEVTE